MNVNKRIPITFQKLNKFEIQDDDTRFIPVKIWLMHLEENLNGSYFSKEVVENAIPSLSNTPILAYMEKNSEGEIDFSDHRQVLIVKDDSFSVKYLGQAIGTIPESNNAQFEERLCDDGITRTFLTVEGLIWTKWDEPVDILNRDMFKSESMELHDDYEGEFNKEDGLFHFSKFRFFGACGLGIDTLPAMQNASIELNFNLDSFKNEIQEKMEKFKMAFAKNDESKIIIDNSKDLANISGSWSSVNKTTLRNKFTKASNVKSLVEEAYLIVDDGWEDSPSTSLHYPHHQLKGDKLILHKAGLESAYSRLMTMEVNNTDAINHLKRHYEELGLDTSIFEKGGTEMDKETNLEQNQFESGMPTKDEMDKMMGDMNDDSKEIEDKKEMPLDKDMMSLDKDKQVKEEFSLTSEQLEDELSRILGQEKYKDDWDWECSCYYYIDHIPDQSIVIAYDCEDRYLVGFNYTINGDVITIDMESEKRFKVDYIPMQAELDEDDKQEFSFVPTVIYEHYRDGMKEKESIKSQFSQVETELTELREFKATKLAEERSEAESEIFAKFSSELTEEEMKTVKENSSKYSLEEMEDKLFAIAGRKKVKFSNTPKVERIKMGIFEEQKDSQIEKDVWTEQKEKFSPNK